AAGAAAKSAALRREIPATVTLGISGDHQAADALLAGADMFCSVTAGLWPRDIRALTDAALAGDEAQAAALNGAFEPLWTLFRRHGSLRVIAAACASSPASAASVNARMSRGQSPAVTEQNISAPASSASAA
ncbi:dihydrodipicolinate synthase family protein, partial [Cronobacter turicensis]